jgi:flavin reductase (DIM6/NTAB) family NADH-FMN oxidoreductase RutF
VGPTALSALQTAEQRTDAPGWPAAQPDAVALVDRAMFAGIMSAFPTGVSIITTVDGSGVPRGLTSNAICSVSADPPLVLACVDAGSNTLPALLDSGLWVVNFLARDRGGLSDLFATKATDKFQGVAWRPAVNGMPWLHADSLSHAACRTVQVIEAGDHVILIGQVEGGAVPNPADHPLVYFRRAYHRLPAM